MTATSNPKTYLCYFKGADRSPFADVNTNHQILANVYHLWRTAAAPLTLVELMETFIVHFDSRAVGGLGIFVTGMDGHNRLQVLHSLCRYNGALGLMPHLQNKLFGFLETLTEVVE